MTIASINGSLSHASLPLLALKLITSLIDFKTYFVVFPLITLGSHFAWKF